MSIIPGYRDLKKIYESHKTLVYRGYREQNSQAIILKILKKSYPNTKDLARYQHEYEIICQLNSPGIIKAYSLERYQNTILLVLEDFGGDSLKTLLERRSLTVEDFLDIAIGIVQSLHTIHAAHIIHKDINPANIIVNLATEQVKIIDFGIATALPIEHPTVKAAPKLEGTLPYLSPEQTGRMNRMVDYRSDFYSLGATFYEMLTQCQPFSTLDTLELIHSHLAKPVNPPHLISPNIPVVLSEITLKLLSKNAEDRYQSVWGIQADLETCRHQWRVNQSIPLFTLAAEDHSAQLQISQQLYGREAELETLKAVFQRLLTPPLPENPKSGTEVVMISGDSGMGKTLLAHSLSPLLSECRGYLITGKIVQTQPSTPYSAIVLALQNLVELLLGESDEQLIQWREQLLNGLGANASLLVEMVPDMALILGLQPVLPELEAQAAQQRLYRTLQQLVGIFAQPEHPLVLFVDDLQWADAESLALMAALIHCSESAYMLFIGAYRNDEAQNCQAFIEELRTDQSGLAPSLHLTEISLTALSSTAVAAFISDTLGCEPASITALSEVVLAKTKGNPFFIAEFLRAIYHDQSLYFDAGQKQWHWHLDKLWQQTITDNVVDLLVARLSKLSATTQMLLKWAACQGHRFDLETLALISEQSQSEIHQCLQTALLEGLVYQITTNQQNEYQFTHDRVQQAIYRLIPDLEKTHVHWQIGLRLLSKLAIERISFETLSVPWIYSDQLAPISVQQVFNIANQLNRGAPSVPLDVDNSTHAAVHTAWLKLNLLAGQQAKQTAAYGVALTYFEQAIRLLGFAAWQQHYNLTLMLYEKTAEAAYASSQYERLADLAQTLCLNAQTVVERVNTDQRVIQAHIGRNQPLDALKVGLSLLSELGIQFPQQPSSVDIGLSLQAVQRSLAGRDIQSLIHLPEMNVAEKIAAMQILSAIFVSAYFAIPVMVPLITCMQVKLSLEYGNTPLSALAYTYYGLILCGQLGEIETGYQFGELALSLLAQPRFCQQPLKHIRARTLMTVAGFVKHFREPIRHNIPLLLEAYELGLETGDLEIAGHAASMYALHAYVIGRPLITLEQELTAYSETLKQLKQAADLNFIQIYHQGILNWMGQAEICSQLAGEVYNEAQMIPQYEQTGNRSALYLAFYEKGLLCYSFGEFTAALAHMTKAATYLDAVTGSYNTALFYFYDSLIRLALFFSCSVDEQAALIAKVEENQQYLKKGAEQAPANYLNKFSLVEAERYRVLEQSTTAIDYYEQAIAQAIAQDLIYDEALAYELAGYFHLKQRQSTIAQFYLLNARYCYQRWGALGKVAALERQYPALVTQGNFQRTLGFTTTLTSSPQSIDVATVIKATQALGSEIALDKLLNKLMDIVLENAGAQRGVLMLLREGQWFIEAEAVASVFSRAISTPLHSTEPSHLPISVINYVMRKGKSLVLENAHQNGQFIQDAYIRHNASKSVLCMPLLNQGQLHGLLYLENGLATGVFTWERVEVLKILSAQAVISLENAQLYKQLDTYNKNLEQKVAARTQELSETLNILQATQAELVIENALLRRQDDRAYTYQVGGSLPMDAPTYVVRQADRHLYKALSYDQYCYILNSRQMGKSSLRIQMMKRMQAEGYRCIALDFSVIGNHQTRIEQWYAGLAYSLANSLKLLPNLNLRDWWQVHDWLSPIQRWDAFIREIVLQQIEDKIIVFIDEIDSVLSLDFRADDFFVWLRTCFNYRADHPEYRRLTFVLLGVATPAQLISDRNRTPFNIGQAISLSGFQLHEAQPLLEGLRDRVLSPQALLKQILTWTQGQPFLTQKLCQLVCQNEEPIPEGAEAAWVDQLVRSHILTHWERQDDPEHLKTICDRILSRGPLVAPMLNCYQQILQGCEVVAQDLPSHIELQLSGLVIKDDGQLKVANQIYRTIFDVAWVTHHQTRLSPSD